MAQSRRHSIYETVSNTAIGYVVNLGGQLVFYPMLGYHMSFGDNLALGGCFTVLSIVRGYVVRRMYNTRSA